MTFSHQFELHNDTVNIHFSETGMSGKRQLVIQKGQTTNTFEGEQILIEDIAIGTLVSVTLDTSADCQTVRLALLLPQVNIPDGKQQVSVRTQAAESVVHAPTNKASAEREQVQTYTFYEMTGYARISPN